MNEQVGAIKGWRANGSKRLDLHYSVGPDGVPLAIFRDRVWCLDANGQLEVTPDYYARQIKGICKPQMEVVRR